MPHKKTYRDVMTIIAILLGLSAMLIAVRRRPTERYDGLLNAIRKQTIDLLHQYAYGY